MRTIETDRLPGDVYVVERDDDLSNFPEDFIIRIVRWFATTGVSTGVFYREEYPEKGPMVAGLHSVDASDAEIIDLLAESREFFLEDRNTA